MTKAKDYERAMKDIGWISVEKYLPPMGEEVMVLTNEMNGHNLPDASHLCFAHRPDPEVAVCYDGWNIPGVKYWLYCPELPIESNHSKLSDNLEDAAGVKETPINLDDEIVEYWKVMEWSKSIPLSKFKVIARYFYGLGLAERLKITMAEDKEVKSAAVTTADRLLANPKDYALSAKADYWNGSYEGFIAGAQWQKDSVNIDISKQIAAAFQLGVKDKEEQMMKEAVETELYWDGDFLAIDLNMAALGYSERDKVRVIIVKEDNQ